MVEWPRLVEAPILTLASSSSNVSFAGLTGVSLHKFVFDRVPVIPWDHYSSYTQLKRVTAWMVRFVRNCLAKRSNQTTPFPLRLVVQELRAVEASATFFFLNTAVSTLQRESTAFLSAQVHDITESS